MTLASREIVALLYDQRRTELVGRVESSRPAICPLPNRRTSKTRPALQAENEPRRGSVDWLRPQVYYDCGRASGEMHMATDIRLKEGLPEITESLVSTYVECSKISHLGHKPLPSRA